MLAIKQKPFNKLWNWIVFQLFLINQKYIFFAQNIKCRGVNNMKNCMYVLVCQFVFIGLRAAYEFPVFLIK